MKNLETMGVQEMIASEMKEENGGKCALIEVWGLFDGIPGNTEVYILCHRII